MPAGQADHPIFARFYARLSAEMEKPEPHLRAIAAINANRARYRLPDPRIPWPTAPHARGVAIRG